MKLVLKNVQVLDYTSKYHNKKVSIVIEEGIISIISEKNDFDGIDLKGAIVTNGLVAMYALLNEPGNEYKEDIKSGLLTASVGGFTHLCSLPNTTPAIDNSATMEFLKAKANHSPVDLLQIVALSEQIQGKKMTEMYELFDNGAIAFSDGISSLQNTELLMIALQYVSTFDGLIINQPFDNHIAKGGQMHEGLVSTSLGLKSIPNIAESIMVQRDLTVLSYTGGRLHFAGISTPESVNLIKNAKAQGLNVTCDVAIHNLIFTDKELIDFDTNFKVLPPLRTEKEQNALIEGIKDNTIDAISIYHIPQDTDCKEIEFNAAEFGMISLQTAIHCINKLSDKIPIPTLLEKINHSPRKIFNLPSLKIEENQPAILSILDFNKEWLYNEAINTSKSKNSPFFNQKLKGQAIGIINGKKHFFNS